MIVTGVDRCLFCAIALVLTWASSAFAMDATERVVLLCSGDRMEKAEILYEVLGAHLVPYDVEVIIRKADKPGSKMGNELPEVDSVERARKMREAVDALAAVWIEIDARKLGVLIYRPETDEGPAEEQVVMRSLPVSSQNWRVDCELISALIRAALTPFLTRERSALEPQPSVAVQLTVTEDEKPWDKRDNSVEAGANNPLLTLRVRAAVSAVLGSWKDVPSFGGALAFDTLYRQRLGLRVQAGIYHQDDGKNVVLNRIPTRIGIVGWMVLPSWAFGFAAEGIMELLRWSGPDALGEAAYRKQLVPGGGFTLLGRISASEQLRFVVEAGLDIMGGEWRYDVGWNHRIVYERLQPRFSIGFSFGAHLVHGE